MSATIQPPTPGALDPAFSYSGIQSLALELHFNITAAQGLELASDGYIHIAAQEHLQYALVRLDDEGDPDLNFARLGVATGQFDSQGSGASSVQRLSDGRFLVKGHVRIGAEHYPAAACFNRYGSEDKTFGTNGRVILAPPFARLNWTGFEPTELTGPVTRPTSRQPSAARQIHAGNRILMGARIDSRTVIVSLTSNGSLDTSFAGTGYVVVEHGQPGVWLEVIHDLSGKVLVAGSKTAPGESVPRPFMARYNGDASVDTTFGNQGSVTISNLAGHLTDLVLTAAGKIVGVGYSIEAGQEKAMLIGRNHNGSPDTAFNKGNPVITSVDNAPGAWMSGAIASMQQKIVVSGGTYGTHSIAVVGRFNSDGSQDLSFGHAGLARLDLGEHTGSSGALVQTDQKILICGQFIEQNSAHGYVARFLG